MSIRHWLPVRQLKEFFGRARLTVTGVTQAERQEQCTFHLTALNDAACASRLQDILPGWFMFCFDLGCIVLNIF